jgi:phosphate acetyltransferase
MDVINSLRQKAKARLKTIVLPEFADRRVSEAVRILEKDKLAEIILLTEDKIRDSDKDRYIGKFYDEHQAKDLGLEEVKQLFDGTLYYAAMMVSEGKADGIVAGASYTTADIARCYMRCIGIDQRFNVMAGCFIIAVEGCPYGDNGTFVFADCGIIPEPNGRQLGCIAVNAAELTQKVLGIVPRIAFLSYSTKGSAKARSSAKIAEALEAVRQLQPELLVDGEMQVDAAIVPEVSRIKCPDSPVGGRANVLIFPSLDAGNIGYKLSERLAGARAIGPLILGLNKPASDLSRGCSSEDVIDCVAVTAIRAQ